MGAADRAVEGGRVFCEADFSLAPKTRDGANARRGPGFERRSRHPLKTIDRRWELGLKNFHEIYNPIVSTWELYDNSEATPILLEKGC